MAEVLPPVCSACHETLDVPEEEVEHPDDPDPPEDAHFKVQIRSDDEERLQCKTTGKLAKVVFEDDDEYPDGMGEGGEQDREPTSEDSREETAEPIPEPAPQEQPQRSQSPPSGASVYDLKEDKDQIDILMEVVSNPSYDLSNEQVQEIRAWAHDYGGQMPPDALEDIVKLMSGVQKQTAQLIKQRYELKLNKWVRERTTENSGPLIGIGTSHQMPAGGGGQPQPDFQQGPSPEAMEAAEKEALELEEAGEFSDDLDSGKRGRRERMQDRRQERQQRREEALEAFAEEMAIGTAENLSQEAGEGLVRFRNVLLTVLESKARKDPDWFFEMAERLDVDPVDLLEPSEARKREKQRSGSQEQPEVDGEVDSVVQGLSEQPDETEPDQPERVKEEPGNDIRTRAQDAQSGTGWNEHEDMMTEEDGDDTGEEEAFEEIFG